MNRHLITLLGAAIVAVFACSSCALFNDDYGLPRLKYLAIQADEDDDWSIVNPKGEVVVENEYSSSDRVTAIFGDTYWVGSKAKGNDGESRYVYSLYSIKSPKKAITDVEYDRVTPMFHDRSLVSRTGQPIKILDEDGDVVATLPKDIVEASETYGPYFLFKKANGKYGWMTRDGEVLKEGFAVVCMSYGSIVLARQKDDGPFIIFDGGKETGKFNADDIFWAFSDGHILAKKDGQCLLFGNDGKQKQKFSKKYDSIGCFLDGMAVFRNEEKEKWGIINDEGEELVRAKYDGLYMMGDGLYASYNDDKWGIINSKGEEKVPEEYRSIVFARLGDNFIVKGKHSASIVDEDGNDLGESFDNFSVDGDYYVYFVDMTSLAADISRVAEAFDPRETAADVALREGRMAASTDEYSWNLESNVAESFAGKEAKGTYEFENRVATQKSHEEEYVDYWGDTVTRTVWDDAYEWSDAKVKSVTYEIPMETSVSSSETVTLLKAAMEKRGWTDNGSGEMEKSVSGVLRHISISGSWSSITLTVKE